MENSRVYAYRYSDGSYGYRLYVGRRPNKREEFDIVSFKLVDPKVLKQAEIGDEIIHEKFGKGKIVELTKTKSVVEFEEVGYEKLTTKGLEGKDFVLY